MSLEPPVECEIAFTNARHLNYGPDFGVFKDDFVWADALSALQIRS